MENEQNEMKEILDYIVDELKEEVHTSLPGRIEKLDLIKGYCTVQILPKRILCREIVSVPPLINVMLDFKNFGGWKIRYPYIVGDLVWVGFSELDYYNVLDGKEKEPVSWDRFSLNGAYIKGSITPSSLNYNSSYLEDIVIEGKGTIILIKGNGEIFLKTGANKMTIESNLEIKGNITQTGNFTQTGNITTTGSIGATKGITSVTGDVKAGDISLLEHTHGYEKPQHPAGSAKTTIAG